MIPLALCSSNGCPGIWLDGDDVVVQGRFAGLVPLPVAAPLDADREAKVRIPADVLRRAVLGSVLGYHVMVDGAVLAVHPSAVRVAFVGELDG